MIVEVEGVDAGLRDVEHFISTWTLGDRYDRFGTTSESAARWLIEQLGDPAHQGLIARTSGEVIALLDFVHTAWTVEFGLFVEKSRRRGGVGRELLRHLLRQLPIAEIVVGHCRFQNRAAMAFLSACAFTMEYEGGGDCRWSLPIVASSAPDG